MHLQAEYHAGLASQVPDLDAYRRLEDRLFRELRAKVYAGVPPSAIRQVNRYHPGSRTDPGTRPVDWNRTFELAHEDAAAGVLMLHGLSDSPYSMRALGERLHAAGAWVVGLRIPGHGTTPSALLDVTWRDFAAAVRLAARHLAAHLPAGRPLHLVGYSNGAALAVEYSLSVLEGEPLPKPEALILLSPAVSVSPVAALAIWQARLARIAGLRKLAWNAIQPEFDPYKYNSFTVNAGDQIYQLTREIAARLERLAGVDPLASFPRVLAFQSVVDATIPPATLVDVLLARLAREGHHALVLFDVNRNTESEPLLTADPETLTGRLLEDDGLPFSVTLVTNASPSSDRLVARTRPPGGATLREERLGLSWPPGVFSLSHVAVPFPPDDPVYGSVPRGPALGRSGITLGNVVVRGERNLLQIPDSFFLRLRYNPFFSYLTERALAFLGMEPAR